MMPPRYLLQSAGFHLFILGMLAFAPWMRRSDPILWLGEGFDVYGGGGGGGGGPKAEQMGQVVPEPVKAPVPAKPQPVQKAVKGEETWKVKDKVETKKTAAAPVEDAVERGETTQKQQSNVIRRGVAEGTTAGEGGYDFGSGSGGGGPGIGIGFGPGSGGGFGFGGYLKVVRQRIWQEWNQSAVWGTKQTCIVAMTISMDGTVSDIKLERSSGNAFFDNVAMRAVRNSNPLPPLPPSFPKSSERFRIQFRLQD